MTAKVPYPRQLQSNETLDTLTHWKSHVRNYFRRDEHLNVFFQRASSWDCTRDNYGFTGQDGASKADYLEGLLDTIAGFMPGPYLTAQITRHTTCMSDVFQVIWTHYDVDPNPSTFLDFDSLSLEPSERYIDLYYRMIYHAEQHLLQQGTLVNGVQVARTETLSHSHKNLIALQWIKALDKNLVAIVKLEKHKELKEGKQLYTLANDIAKNVDEWMRRHGHNIPKRPAPPSQPDAQVRNVRFNHSFPRGTGRGNFRGGYRGNSRSGFHNSGQNQGPRMFCPGCNYLAQEMKLDINYRHLPANCPRKKSTLRMLQLAEQELDAADPIEQEPEAQIEGVQHDSEDHEESAYSQYQGKGVIMEQYMSKNEQNSTKKNPMQTNVLLDTIDNEVVKSSNVRSIWKSKSPSITVFYNDLPLKAIIDEGSEISVIDANIAEQYNISISSTVEEAKSAGSLPLQLSGKTKQDVIVTIPINETYVQWNLGQCIVVNNLGCDVLIGEPAKAMNNILTHPISKTLSTKDISSKEVVLQYDANFDAIPAKINKVSTLFPNDTVEIKVPSDFQNMKEVIIVPNEKKTEYPAGIFPIKNGYVNIENVSKMPILLNKDDTFYFTKLNSVKKDTNPVIRKIYDINEDNFIQYVYPHHDQSTHLNVTDEIQLDPDNVMSPEWKRMFMDTIKANQDIFTDTPGRYNGFFGQVSCSLTLTGNPPPSLKPKIPNYSNEKMAIMADLMDKMEAWGVLVKPETIGVIPTHVHPCILVPKSEDKFRLVTDFRSIQNHVKQLPTSMPTVSDAMTALSAANYHIELDFSNFYWQLGIPREDSDKLAVCHPYGGLRVYTVSPQGLRNSAEWGSEILARVYGDMVKHGKCTRIADQIYVLGESLQDLLTNFKTVLNKAKSANLTFKPSKVIVCPKDTVILGWKKSGHQWIPTEHIISPLSKAEPPSTVKKMRGWLGSFRQIAKTIPNHSSLLQPFEKLVGGKNSKDRIVWTPELIDAFDKAKKSVSTSMPITIPKPTDKLKIYTDWSQDTDAVGGRLIVERTVNGSTENLHGGEFSCRLKGAQSRWTCCEKESLAIKLLVHHFQPYIRESKNITTIHTDNIVAVHAWNAIQLGKVSTSARVASFISTMCENTIEIVHIPGHLTKVADYNSRHPVQCNNSKCQLCKYSHSEILLHDSYVRTVSSADFTLTERPTWLALQQQDPTHQQLVRLINTGQSPEKKSKNTSLKLMHNLYRRGILFVAKDGLVQVKHADIAHDVHYNTISVPEIYFPSLVQSFHVKLNHPSAYQLHKHINRQFYCLAMAKIINNISSSCDVCSRLKILPKEVNTGTTQLNETFGKNFSADILVEKGQHIIVCREKLSQFTFSRLLQDETKHSVQEALISMIIDFIPDTGTLVQVDPGPSLVPLLDDKVLHQFHIKVDIGRVHNKQKNPVAENTIKEFRKEWLRLKPDGASLSETERAQVTNIMNKRIRLNGLAPKEYLLKRNLANHENICVNDQDEGKKQFERRTKINEKQAIKESLSKNLPTEQDINIGDRVYIKSDLTKSRGREEYIVTKKFLRQEITWITVRKSQKGFRNKEYLLKLSEVFKAPFTTSKVHVGMEDDEDYDEPLHGFQEQVSLSTRDKLSSLISDIQMSLPQSKSRGRPKTLQYPDYLNPLTEDVQIDENDETFHGFDSNEKNQAIQQKKIIQDVISQLQEEIEDSDDDCNGFEDSDYELQIGRSNLLKKIIEENESSMNNVRFQKIMQKKKIIHGWNYDEWIHILDMDLFEAKQNTSKNQQSVNMFAELPNSDCMLYNEDDEMFVNSFSFDDEEFKSFNDQSVLEQTVINEILSLEMPNITDFDRCFLDTCSSTPKKRLFKSVTDPLMLDKIPILSSSESSIEDYEEKNVQYQQDLEDVFKVNVNQVVKMDKMLNQVHAMCPSLQTPVPGAVYQMDEILEDIFPTHGTDRPQGRPVRSKNKHDYKKLNTKGFQ